MVYLSYRAETVGPICKHLAAQDPATFKVVHEDDLVVGDLVSPRVAPLPTPVDPLNTLWDETLELLADLGQIRTNLRSPVLNDGLTAVVSQLDKVRAAIRVPAPVAPPTSAALAPRVLVRFGSRREIDADVVINTAAAVRNARDKRESRRLLGTLAPRTWITRESVVLPCVVRPRRHFAGRRFFVCHTQLELNRAITRCGPGWYASEIVAKAREFRVFILQDRVIRISEKFPADSTTIAWNFAVGGATKGVVRKNWPIDTAKTALKAARALGLDWTAIDVALGTDGRSYVFEGNTQPGITGKFALEQIAWAFASVPNTPRLDRLNLDTATTWQDLIHPSLLTTQDDGN